MNEDQLKLLFPNSSRSFLRANSDVGDSRKVAKLEPNPRHGASGKAQVQKRTSEKFLVRVTSFRKHLLDYDNLCEKYHVDCCRYAGIVPSDDPKTTQIEVYQVKVPKGKEYTRVEVLKR